MPRASIRGTSDMTYHIHGLFCGSRRREKSADLESETMAATASGTSRQFGRPALRANRASIAFERVQGLLDFGLLQVVFCDSHCIGRHRVFHALPGQRVCDCIHTVDANLIGALSDEGLDKTVLKLLDLRVTRVESHNFDRTDLVRNPQSSSGAFRRSVVGGKNAGEVRMRGQR